MYNKWSNLDSDKNGIIKLSKQEYADLSEFIKFVIKRDKYINEKGIEKIKNVENKLKEIEKEKVNVDFEKNEVEKQLKDLYRKLNEISIIEEKASKTDDLLIENKKLKEKINYLTEDSEMLQKLKDFAPDLIEQFNEYNEKIEAENKKQLHKNDEYLL